MNTKQKQQSEKTGYRMVKQQLTTGHISLLECWFCKHWSITQYIHPTGRCIHIDKRSIISNARLTTTRNNLTLLKRAKENCNRNEEKDSEEMHLDNGQVKEKSNFYHVYVRPSSSSKSGNNNTLTQKTSHLNQHTWRHQLTHWNCKSVHYINVLYSKFNRVIRHIVHM